MAVVASTIEAASRWGGPAVYRCWKHAEGSDRLWILFPGQSYTLDAPLMWYAAKAALQANCDVLGVEYGFQANRRPMRSEDLPAVVSEAADAIAGFMQGKTYRKIGHMAKSLGTAAAAGLARTHPADACVFMTPLRNTIPFIQGSSRMLVVVGSQDPLFKAEDVEKITGLPGVRVHVVPDADHSLEIDGDVGRSIGILERTIALCASFF